MQKGFLIYYDILDSLELLNHEDRGMLFLAIVRYASTGEMPEGLSACAQMLFSTVRRQIDRDAEKYQQICYRRSIAGKKGGQASVVSRYGTEKADFQSDTDSVKVPSKGSDFDYYYNRRQFG